MKIGIITLPFHTNYGGILQAFALQKVLMEMGHDVFVIDRKYRPGQFKKVVVFFFYTIKSILYRKKFASKTYCYNRAALYFNQFINTNFPNYINKNDKKSIDAERYDALVVGSDQVWKRTYSKDYLFYFLDFCTNLYTKKIAYAASFGNADVKFTNEEKVIITNLLEKFSGVSVREDDAVLICKNNFNIEVEWVLDPTLLLHKDDYLKVCERYPIREKHKLVSFILDPTPEKDTLVFELSKLVNSESFAVNDYQYMGTEVDKIKILPRVEYWLQELANADYIITDSFHGTAFAINFNKKVFVINNQRRGQSRLKSVLKMVGLENFMVNNINDLKLLYSMDIDWESVNNIIEEKRLKSLLFLKNSLL